MEYKGKSDLLKVGQYIQYALVELGLILTRCLSKERKDRSGREWLSQKGVLEYWNKLKSQGAKHLCTTTILSTRDPNWLGRQVRSDFHLRKPPTRYHQNLYSKHKRACYFPCSYACLCIKSRRVFVQARIHPYLRQGPLQLYNWTTSQLRKLGYKEIYNNSITQKLNQISSFVSFAPTRSQQNILR